MPKKSPVLYAFLAAGLYLCLTSPADAERLSVSLGQAAPGTIDTFEVEARNQSCDQPQDFKFVPRNLPWLKLVNGSAVKGIARGRSKKLVARIDLTGLRPGRYSGWLDVVCETCGALALTSCRIDTETIAVEVEVVQRGARVSGGGPATVRAISD